MRHPKAFLNNLNAKEEGVDFMVIETIDSY